MSATATTSLPTAVLGIWDGHDASVSLVADGALVFALSEERPSRIKRYSGFPQLALRRALDWAENEGLRISDVALAGNWGRAPLRVFEGAYSRRSPRRNPLSPASAAVRNWENLTGRLPGLRRLERHTGLLAATRRMRRALGVKPRLTTVEHHEAHAASALFGATDEPAMVVTWDAYGEGVALTCRSADRFAHPAERHPPAVGLARLYGAVTVGLGFSEGDEGKVMGLAARGDAARAEARFAELFASRRGAPRLKQRLTGPLVRRLLRGLSREDVAAGLQATTERITSEWVGAQLARAGCDQRLLLAGGLFANIRVNQSLAALPGVSGLYVFPNMGDGGLSAGAAAHVWRAATGAPLQPLRDAFVGLAPESDDLAAVARSQPEHRRVAAPAESIAEHLRAGRVVCRYAGRDEFGPRALGNHSVLFSAADPALGDRVNAALDRDDFMPFGPAITEEAVGGLTRSELDAADLAYMTVATGSREALSRHSPGAVHLDGTTRPQVVSRATAPELHAVLSSYASLGAPPVVINTSFNLHGEPIVHTPADAVSTFRRSGLDILMLGDWEIGR